MHFHTSKMNVPQKTVIKKMGILKNVHEKAFRFTNDEEMNALCKRLALRHRISMPQTTRTHISTQLSWTIFDEEHKRFQIEQTEGQQCHMQWNNASIFSFKVFLSNMENWWPLRTKWEIPTAGSVISSSKPQTDHSLATIKHSDSCEWEHWVERI